MSIATLSQAGTQVARRSVDRPGRALPCRGPMRSVRTSEESGTATNAEAERQLARSECFGAAGFPPNSLTPTRHRSAPRKLGWIGTKPSQYDSGPAPSLVHDALTHEAANRDGRRYLGYRSSGEPCAEQPVVGC